MVRISPSPTKIRKNTSSTSNSLSFTDNSLVTSWRIQKRIDEQFQNFAQGFNELIPQDLINVFDERELELLIGGIAEMDVDDWKKHTDYRGYTESDDVVQWFWKVQHLLQNFDLYQAIRTWDAEKKSRLLQFTTGTSRIPVNGFKDLQGSDGPRRFTIEKAGDISQLPKAHTWYNSPYLTRRTDTVVSIVSICRRTNPMISLSPSSLLQ